jgi:hypothetical protein
VMDGGRCYGKLVDVIHSDDPTRVADSMSRGMGAERSDIKEIHIVAKNTAARDDDFGFRDILWWPVQF